MLIVVAHFGTKIMFAYPKREDPFGNGLCAD
jgi:hypothetical protein